MISVCLDYHHAAICLCCQTYEIILVSWCFGVQPRQAFMIDAKHAGIQLSSTNLISSVQRIWIGAIHHCCTDQWCYVSFYTYCSRLSRLFIWPRRVLFLLSEVQQSDFFFSFAGSSRVSVHGDMMPKSRQTQVSGIKLRCDQHCC